jgi:anti-sigma B factor antagonist
MPKIAAVAGEAFAVSIETVDSHTRLVAVSGEIDFAVSKQFEEKLEEAIGDPGTRAVVVDLTNVTFVGSDALNALVHAFERRPGPRANAALVSSDRRVSMIFEITRLDSIFPILATRDEAVAQLRA